MKLRYNKTGEIGVLNISNNKYQVIAYGLPLCGNSVLDEYDTLDALMQEWEDYEESKDSIKYIGLKWEDYDHTTVEIQYQTKEKAEKAVEKLKVWKRLKQGGFHWNSWTLGGAHFGVDLYDGYNNDLDLVFGGEE